MTAQRRRDANSRRRLILTSLLASSALGPACWAADAAPDAGTAVQEVVVTATKRSESMQRVPITIQALTPKILADHQVSSFDDYAKLVPGLSFQSFGPGQSEPYFRGVTAGDTGGVIHSGALPATGVYLDEIPVTTIGSAVDVHLYDLARVEALEGPQGTLYGASSLAGTLRIITNPPDPSHFSAAYDLQGDKFGPGGLGGEFEGYVNEPIGDKAAIRLVGYVEHDGGYIDNVFKQRSFTLTNGATLTENNAPYVKKDFNDVDTWGGRAALRLELNESWTVTPSVNFQEQWAHGNFLYNKKYIGDLKTADFSPEYNNDKWYQAALTIQGKIGDWDVIYAGGYLGRHIQNAQDYSYYAVAYNANGASSYVTFCNPTYTSCLDPDQHFNSDDVYTKETHELRLSSPSQHKVRGIGGVFYERQTDRIIANYIVPGLGGSGDPRSIPGAGDDIYYTNIYRIDRDFAVFGEVSVDLFPDVTATLGGRYFTVDNTLDGVSGFVGSTNFHKGTTEYGETHKVNLSWKIDPQHMVYATYSTGFRPGGANRRSVIGQTPITPYVADTLSNYEIGAKTSWLGGRLRVNGAIFDEEWHDVQFALSPPGGQGITAIFNVGYARSWGGEGDITYHLDDHWTLSASGTVLQAQLTTTFCSATLAGGCNLAARGTELPIAPRYKFNATVRYDFDVEGYKNFLQASAQTQGSTRSALLTDDESVLGKNSGFTTVDLSAGTGHGDWTFQAFVQNVFDERGILGTNVDCAVNYCGPWPLNYPTKPQFFGVKFGQKF